MNTNCKNFNDNSDNPYSFATIGFYDGVAIIYQKETRVMYAKTEHYFAPLLNPDGSPLIYDENE